MIRVKKYNKKLQTFNREKIIDSIQAASERAGQDMPLTKIEKIAETIENELILSGATTISTDDVAALVEKSLMASSYKDVAKEFITFRHDKQQEHVYNSDLLKAFKKKLNGVNIENANANSDERSFSGRMNEASRVLLKDDALNTMSKQFKSHHINNRIYTHDLDSYSSGQHNCFCGGTEFVTEKGIIRFDQCINGETVTVLDKDGNWRKATVKNYGYQEIQKVELEYNAPDMEPDIVEIFCTKDHRWYLTDGSVTTSLQIDNILYQSPAQKEKKVFWRVVDITDTNKKVSVWCVEEPVTNSFTLANGIVTGNCLSIPFDNLLKNGVAIKQTDLRSPKSISTAFQLIAVLMQVQSLQQFGRQYCL